MNKLDAAYWSERYSSLQIGWDTGGITTPLKEYFDQLENKDIAILIPGCGNGYEAEYLFNNGFKNVWVVDLAKEPLINLKKRCPMFPDDQLINGDFFNVEKKFDLIVEQTFFCALHPSMRADYVKMAHQLLNPNGKLMGLLFNCELNDEFPPFGGSKDEYVQYFEEHFEFDVFAEAYNSIKPRAGSELFILLRKMNQLRNSQE